MEALLPTLHAFEAASGNNVPEENSSFREGMKLIYTQLTDTLNRLGLEKVDVAGKPFDPETAEAVTMISVPDAEPETVIQVLTSAYAFKDKILRPAKVVVAAAPAGPSNSEGKNEQETMQ